MAAFIVFEGGEGAGKSTHARSLSHRLTDAGYPTILVREPGGTDLGEAVRRWLKTPSGIAPLTELFLFAAARAQLVNKVLLPALDSNQNVICDRFTASTVAYQGYGRGLDMDLIDSLNKAATSSLRPDLTVLLDLPIEIGLSRKRDSSRDTFEREAMEFHERVRKGYLDMASRESAGWLSLDATQKKEALEEQIWTRVRPLLT